MAAMLEYLSANKDWIFSGIGVVANGQEIERFIDQLPNYPDGGTIKKRYNDMHNRTLNPQRSGGFGSPS